MGDVEKEQTQESEEDSKLDQETLESTRSDQDISVEQNRPGQDSPGLNMPEGPLLQDPFCQKLLSLMEKNYTANRKTRVGNFIDKFKDEMRGSVDLPWVGAQNYRLVLELAERLQLPAGSVWKIRLLRRVITSCLSINNTFQRERARILCEQVLQGEIRQQNIPDTLDVIFVTVPKNPTRQTENVFSPKPGGVSDQTGQETTQHYAGTQKEPKEGSLILKPFAQRLLAQVKKDYPIRSKYKVECRINKFEWELSGNDRVNLHPGDKILEQVSKQQRLPPGSLWKLQLLKRVVADCFQKKTKTAYQKCQQFCQEVLRVEFGLKFLTLTPVILENATTGVKLPTDVAGESGNPTLPGPDRVSDQTSQKSTQPALPGLSSQGTAQKPAGLRKETIEGSLCSEPFCKKLLSLVKRNYPIRMRFNVAQRINKFKEELNGNDRVNLIPADKIIEQLSVKQQLPSGSVWKLQLLKRVVVDCLPQMNQTAWLKSWQFCRDLLREEFGPKFFTLTGVIAGDAGNVVETPENAAQQSGNSAVQEPGRVSDQTSQVSEPALPGTSSQGATQQPARSQREAGGGSLISEPFAQRVISLAKRNYPMKMKFQVEQRINEFEEELNGKDCSNWHPTDKMIEQLSNKQNLPSGSIWKLQLLKRVVVDCLPKKTEFARQKTGQLCQNLLREEFGSKFLAISEVIVGDLGAFNSQQFCAKRLERCRKWREKEQGGQHQQIGQRWGQAGQQQWPWQAGQQQWPRQAGQQQWPRQAGQQQWPRQAGQQQWPRQVGQQQWPQPAWQQQWPRQAGQQQWPRQAGQQQWPQQAGQQQWPRQVGQQQWPRQAGQQQWPQQPGQQQWPQPPGQQSQLQPQTGQTLGDAPQLDVAAEKMMLQKEWERLAQERKALDNERALREAPHLEADRHGDQIEQQMSANHDVDYRSLPMTSESRRDRSPESFHGNRSPPQYDRKSRYGDHRNEDRSPPQYDHRSHHGDSRHDDSPLTYPDDTAPRDWSHEGDVRDTYYRQQPRYNEDRRGRSRSREMGEEDEFRHDPYRRDASADRHREPYRPEAAGSYRDDPARGLLAHDNSPPDRRDALYMGSDRREEPTLQNLSNLPPDRSPHSALDEYDRRVAPVPHEEYARPIAGQGFHGDRIHGDNPPSSISRTPSPFLLQQKDQYRSNRGKECLSDSLGDAIDSGMPQGGITSRGAVQGGAIVREAAQGDTTGGGAAQGSQPEMAWADEWTILSSCDETSSRDKERRDSYSERTDLPGSKKRLQQEPRRESLSSSAKDKFGREPEKVDRSDRDESRCKSQKQDRDQSLKSSREDRDRKSNSQSQRRDHRSDSRSQGKDKRSSRQIQDRGHRSSSQSRKEDHKSNSQSQSREDRSSSRRGGRRPSNENKGRDHRSKSQGRDKTSSSQSRRRDHRSRSKSQSRDHKSSTQSQRRDHRSSSQSGHGLSQDHSRNSSQYSHHNIPDKPSQTGRNSQISAKRQRSDSPSPRGSKKGPGEMRGPKYFPKQQQTASTQMWPLQAPSAVGQQMGQISTSWATKSQDMGQAQNWEDWNMVKTYLQQQGMSATEEGIRGILHNEQVMHNIRNTMAHRHLAASQGAQQGTQQGTLKGGQQGAQQGTQQGAQQGTQHGVQQGTTASSAVSQAGILYSEGKPALLLVQTGQQSQPVSTLALPGPASQRATQNFAGALRETREGTVILLPFCKRLVGFVERTYGEVMKEEVVDRINTFEEELKGKSESVWRDGQNNDKMVEQLAQRLQLPPGSVWKLQLLRRVTVDCLPKKTAVARERVRQMCQHVLSDDGVQVTEEIFKVIIDVTQGNEKESSGMTTRNPTPFVDGEMLRTVPSTSAGGQTSTLNTQTVEKVSLGNADKQQMVVAYLSSMGVQATSKTVEGVLQNQQALDSIERIFWTPLQDRQLVERYLQQISVPITSEVVNKIMENQELMGKIKNTLGAPGANVGTPGTSQGGL
uniref:Uncharacterized protein n=1 Tax=Branchiostoma floridae TaxID=7739 RepID=C3Z0S3_BRAFL|eukprot:XP_002597815.1 hypothetical protein BRAFLDRAFT_102843 [Branchiostoma floridae]